jgi:hypothetical protein
LLGGAVLDHTAVHEDHDPLGSPQGGDAVSGKEDSGIRTDSEDFFEDLRFGLFVQMGERIIQDQ